MSHSLYIVVGTRIDTGEEFLPNHHGTDLRSYKNVHDLCMQLAATYHNFPYKYMVVKVNPLLTMP